jgi:hypothetical protein
MTSLAHTPGPDSAARVHGVAAFGVVEADVKERAALRAAPGGHGSVHLAANFHRYSDEQAVASLEAVFRAARAAGMPDPGPEGWGVVAAPRFLGRMVAAKLLHKSIQDGPFAGSPFAVTHHTLHAIAGTVSVALRLRGPSFGAGGGHDNLVEGLLAVLATLAEGQVPGLWAIFSEWDPEQVPDTEGRDTLPAVCRAVALALTPDARAATPWQLRLVPTSGFASAPQAISTPMPTRSPAPTIASLARSLQRCAGAAGRWVCPLEWGGSIQLVEAAA